MKQEANTSTNNANCKIPVFNNVRCPISPSVQEHEQLPATTPAQYLSNTLFIVVAP